MYQHYTRPFKDTISVKPHNNLIKTSLPLGGRKKPRLGVANDVSQVTQRVGGEPPLEYTSVLL